MTEAVIGTFVGRWYVTMFGVVFLLVALRHLGPKRTAIYIAIALVLGVFVENRDRRDAGRRSTHHRDPNGLVDGGPLAVATGCR
jgi:hypothetical protein